MRRYRVTTPYGNVHYVHDNGDIEVNGEALPSGQWKLTGIATYRGRRVVSFGELDEWLASEPDFLHKNGTPRYTATDLDHGTHRMWGNTQHHGIRSLEVVTHDASAVAAALITESADGTIAALFEPWRP